MTKPEFDVSTFRKRLEGFLEFWKASLNKPNSGFNNAKAIAFVSDASDENILYSKTSTMQLWLFGYEFTKTVVIITLEKIFIVTSPTKAKILSEIQSSKSPISAEILVYGKDDSDISKKLSEAAYFLKESGEEVGIFAKDKNQGKFIDSWKKCWEKTGLKEGVDVTSGVALALAAKDEIELNMHRLASRSSANILKNYFVDEMTSIIDQNKKVTHESLSDKTEGLLSNDKELRKAKLPSEIDSTFLDWSYSPIIQSGGNYDLKPSAISDNNKLSSGVILCSLGLRYNNYCSNIGRTFLIDVTPSQEKNYAFLLELQKHILNKLKPRVSFKNLYESAVNFVKSNRPELLEHFTKNIGFLTGIEFREGSLTIQPKSAQVFEENMVLCLSLGFNNIKDNSTKQKYSLQIIDTLKVTNDSAVVLTDALREATDVTYFNNDDKDDKAKAKSSKKVDLPVQTLPAKTAILKSKFRSEDQEETPEQKRREHQRELFQAKNEEGLRRFKGDDGKAKNSTQENFKTFESYKRDTALPKDAKSLGIIVDPRGESIILPINGLAVPFHISTLKNVSKNDEGEYLYLRLNFYAPGQTVSKKEDMPYQDPSAHFLRALTFRSSDTFRLSEIYKRILDLKKDVSKKDAEKKDMADLIQQDQLRLSDGRVSRLQDVFIRPPPEGKRMSGEIEIHSNGLRYKHPRANQNIDILFSNIKHLFFQPCENELLVLIHVHLKDPIMIGKKKVKDVQIYREASDVQFDETGNRRRQQLYGDEDEIEAEMEERRRIKELNDEFKTFATKISDSARGKFEVETPFREIGFHGVPFRSNVLLMPTGDCLVHLSDPPFLVISLSEVEIVHMERVQFGLKNFDIVFIFKDFHRTPFHINTIPMKQLDGVKEWLDSMDVVFTEGPVNLNWSNIIKTIRDDPEGFFDDGGWGFLGDKSDDSGEPSEESASEFELDSEEMAEESDSDYDSEEDSGGDSAASEEDEESDLAEESDDLDRSPVKEDKRKRAPVPQASSKKRR